MPRCLPAPASFKRHPAAWKSAWMRNCPRSRRLSNARGWSTMSEPSFPESPAHEAGDPAFAPTDAALGVAAELEQIFRGLKPISVRGKVSRAVGMLIDASGIQVHVGELCELVTPGEPPMMAEVVGFAQNRAILTPLGRL